MSIARITATDIREPYRTFLWRVIGVLALDASVYEEVEGDRRSAMQSVAVLLGVTAAGGFAAAGLGLVGMTGFAAGALMMLGGWLVWVSLIETLGTTVLAEPGTRSSVRELLRTLGFASAPGLFLVFAAMGSAAPVVLVVVSIWMIAAAVIAARQALDYRSTARALAVCVIGWVASIAFVALVVLVLGRSVS